MILDITKVFPSQIFSGFAGFQLFINDGLCFPLHLSRIFYTFFNVNLIKTIYMLHYHPDAKCIVMVKASHWMLSWWCQMSDGLHLRPLLY